MEVSDVRDISGKIIEEIGSYYVGHKDLLQKVMGAALANGHVLFEDNPGLGKTLLAKAFARTTGCTWHRIQFTPDLMPSDIIGTKIWRSNINDFVLEKGPVFTHILLADEINRSPPKVQAALLECMEERQVTIEGETHILESPFFVMGTQNPIDLEGTYSLPEAQMDRFLLKLSIGYLENLDDEVEILLRRISWELDDPSSLVKEITTNEEFSQCQKTVEKKVHIDREILEYISKIVRATRENPYIEIGASPRASISLFKISKANAAMMGRDYVIPDDVKLYVKDALKHRIILRMEYALDESVTVDGIIDEILSNIETPTQS